MNSSEIKQRFAEHFLDKFVIANELRDLAYCDIVAIDRDLNMREFEIKISISDLRRELNEIDYALTHNHPDGLLNFGVNKKDKHDIYLNGLSPEGTWTREMNGFYCPSTFTFLISDELYEKERERLDKSPYGVMSCKNFQILKPAKHLKEAKKANAQQLWKIAHSQNYKIAEKWNMY